MRALGREPVRELKMNDVGAVRFEALSPLFFDPYAENRTTGSFILIDPLTNATVGAAMIRLALSAETSSDAGLRDAPVSRQERYQRHSHRPGIVLAGKRVGLAERLERTLFTQGFEVVRIANDDFPAKQWGAVLGLAQDAGLVVIHCGEAVGLPAPGGVPCFDLAAMALPEEDEAAVTVILPALQALRDLGEDEAK
jgi:hypothetical protein